MWQGHWETAANCDPILSELSKDKIENMVKDAEKYASEDQVSKNCIEVVNQA